MKINSITTNAIHPKSHTKMRSMKTRRECAYERDNFKTSNNDKINTTIKMQNSDGRVSFKGKVPAFHRLANFASKNPLLAEALYAIIITCGARPLTIMATANTDEEKEKCTYQAVKSISTGVVGLVTTAVVTNFITPAILKASKDIELPEDKEKSKKIINEGLKELQKLAANADTPEELRKIIEKLTENGKININPQGKLPEGDEKGLLSAISNFTKNSQVVDIVKQTLSEQRKINTLNNSQNIIETGIVKLRELADLDSTPSEVKKQILEILEEKEINVSIFREKGKDAEKKFLSEIGKITDSNTLKQIKLAVSEQNFIEHFSKSNPITRKGVHLLNALAEGIKNEGLKSQINELIKGDKINLDQLKKDGKSIEKTFISSISEVADEETIKLIKKALTEQRILNNFVETRKNIFDKLLQPAFLPIRATVTIALVPIILGALGIKKGGKKKEEITNPYTMLNYNIFQTNTEKELFKSFAGVANHEN